MKRVVLVALVASGCRIGDVSFTPLGGGDDGSVDDSMKQIDGGLPPMTRAFLTLEGSPGLWSLTKAANGDLTPAQPTAYTISSGAAMAVATNRTGTHVYVGIEIATGANEIRDIVFSGSTLLGNTSRPLPCAARGIVVHPSQTNIVVTCAQPQTFTYQLDSSGTISSSATQLVTSSNSRTFAAITPDGNCLFLADPNSTSVRIVGLPYDVGTNSYLTGTQINGPTGTVDLVMHPNGNVLYMITDTVVQAYARQTGCGLSALGGIVPVGMTSAIAGQVDPQGGRLFVLGDRIAEFTLASDGRLSANTAATAFNGTFTRGTFDPALPSTMYTVSATATMPGVYQTKIDPGGMLTMSPGFTNTGSPASDFALAP